MALYEYLTIHAYNILKSFIDVQLVLPPAGNESNIENSVIYEKTLAANHSNYIEHASQDRGKDSVKQDCIYSSTNECLEIKTTQSTFNKDGRISIIWVKQNGKNTSSVEKLLKSCPDGLLVYMKFSKHKRNGACLGYVNKDRLLEIIADESRGNRNIDTPTITFYEHDFCWLKTENNIPEFDASAAHEEMKEHMNRQEEERRVEVANILSRNKTGKTKNYNPGPFDDNKGKVLREKNRSEIEKLVDEGRTDDEIFDLMNSRWEFIEKHAGTHRAKLVNHDIK